ncbi:hypothetical protein D3C80_18400 [compost metagenome]
MRGFLFCLPKNIDKNTYVCIIIILNFDGNDAVFIKQGEAYEHRSKGSSWSFVVECGQPG